MNFEDELKQKVQETEKTVYEFLPEEEGFQKTILEAMNFQNPHRLAIFIQTRKKFSLIAGLAAALGEKSRGIQFDAVFSFLFRTQQSDTEGPDRSLYCYRKSSEPAHHSL